MVDAFAENINDATAGDFSLEAMKKLLPFRSVCSEAELGETFGLCSLDKCEEFRQVNRMIAVVIFWIAFDVASGAVWNDVLVDCILGFRFGHWEASERLKDERL